VTHALHTAHAPTVDEVWAALDTLTDPEIPVVTLREMGILRDVRVAADGSMEVVITPTYSGCPAIAQMEDDVRATLQQLGVTARLVTQLAPAWTTDWMTPIARDKLRAYGIAPPAACGSASVNATGPSSIVIQFANKTVAHDVVPCPRCGSHDTTATSHFGSTACKSLYKCLSCMEPFDYFKPY